MVVAGLMAGAQFPLRRLLASATSIYTVRYTPGKNNFTVMRQDGFVRSERNERVRQQVIKPASDKICCGDQVLSGPRDCTDLN